NQYDASIKTDPKTNISSHYAQYTAIVSASQPLYRQQNWIAYDQAKQQVAQADNVLTIAQQDLILRVSQAYFDVLLAQYNIELNDSQKAAVSEQLAQAKRNFEVGVATITDTNEAQAKYDSIAAQEITTRNDYDNKVTALRAIIGRPPKELKKDGGGCLGVPAGAKPDRLLGRPRAERESERPGRGEEFRDRQARGRSREGGPLSYSRPRGEPQLGELWRRRGQFRRRQLLDDREHRRPACGPDLPGRLRRLQSAPGARAAGKGATGPRDGATHGALSRADRIHRRHQRGGVDQGVPAGARVGGSRAAVEQARAGSRHPHQPRRAERPAERVLDAARPRAGVFQLSDRRAAPEGCGRHVERPGRRGHQPPAPRLRAGAASSRMRGASCGASHVHRRSPAPQCAAWK